MAAPDHKFLDKCQLSEGPLVDILVAMVRSALEWEAENHLDPLADSNLTHDSTVVDYARSDSDPLLQRST